MKQSLGPPGDCFGPPQDELSLLRNPCENGPFQPISVIASPATDGSGRSNLSSRRDCFGPQQNFGSLAMTIGFLSNVTEVVREGLAMTIGFLPTVTDEVRARLAMTVAGFSHS